MGNRWKSFWMGSIAAVIIAVVAGVVMDAYKTSASQKFTTSSTRL